MKLNLYQQPTGNSCGPTCLYMAFEYILNHPNDLPFTVPVKYTIEDICKMCCTDWVVGTPPDRMEKGLKALNIHYVEHMCSPRPFDLLKQVINDGNIPILRTITKGAPHWIIIQNADKDGYETLDPWQGHILYTEKELDSIWKPRQYQFFEILVKASIPNETYTDGNGY